MKLKDVLASVLELQKGTCKGFNCDVVCNDLPTIVLFTDKQVNDIIKFVAINKQAWCQNWEQTLLFS